MPSSTQQFLEIDQIKEGVAILKNKSLRGIIMVSSLNFALKSEEEQSAIVYQFQSFLNSLDFPVEVSIQSRKLNITGYLEKLKGLAEKQENELLKTQTAEYYEFIKNLIANGSIMAKNFFVVVPFYMVEVPGLRKADDEQFQRSKSQLWQRMEYVSMGLKRCGLQAVPLDTTELIELFWSAYHPEEAEVGYYPEIPPEIIT